MVPGLEAILARSDVVSFSRTGDGGEPSVQGFFDITSDSMACAHLENETSEILERLRCE